MQKIIIGNWKMNGALDEARTRASAILQGAPETAEIVLCPPFVHLGAVAEVLRGSALRLGAQDCYSMPNGAHTGSISATMLAELGCEYVINGHSERRLTQAESDSIVRDKGRMALASGMVPIVCVGETLKEREAGEAEAVVARQLAGSMPEGDVIIAYEPVWAIGSGQKAKPEDIAAMHTAIRRLAPRMRIIYGGSIKPDNVEDVIALPEVDGLLVGGASLVADDFLAICRAAAATFSP